MKRTMAVLFAALMAAAAVSAQETAGKRFMAGGTLGLMWYQDIGVEFTLSPEATYTLNEKWGVGMGIDLGLNGGDGAMSYAVSFNPYARYSLLKAGQFSLFLDMGFALGGRDGMFTANVGVSPGVMWEVTERVTLLAHCGFLGYMHNEPYNDLAAALGGVVSNAVGFSASSSNLSIGGFVRF